MKLGFDLHVLRSARAIIVLVAAFGGDLSAQTPPSLPPPGLPAMPPWPIAEPLPDGELTWPPLPSHEEVVLRAEESLRERTVREQELSEARAVRTGQRSIVVLLGVAALAIFGLLLGAWTALRGRR